MLTAGGRLSRNGDAPTPKSNGTTTTAASQWRSRFSMPAATILFCERLRSASAHSDGAGWAAGRRFLFAFAR